MNSTGPNYPSIMSHRVTPVSEEQIRQQLQIYTKEHQKSDCQMKTDGLANGRFILTRAFKYFVQGERSSDVIEQRKACRAAGMKMYEW